jgi:Ca2+-binding RTX toxin-like protein
VLITSLATDGTLLFNNVPLVAPQFVTAVQLAAGDLDFVPDAGESNTPYATFTFQVRDDGGTDNGGVDTDASANTFTFNVTASAAPVVDLNGGDAGIDSAASYTEASAAVVLAPGAVVTDADTLTLSSATVSIAAGFLTGFDELTLNGATSGTFLGISFAYTPATGVLALSGAASAADYQAALRTVGFFSTSGDPGTSRTISWIANDGALNSSTALTSVSVTEVDAPPVAQNDAFATDEATPIGTGLNLFDNNGSGGDNDPDGPAFSVIAVSDGGSVGNQFTLPSGALLIVNADGTFDYDPSGAFDETPTPGSGASNQPATDSFIYTITGGDTGTVTINIDGLDTDDTLLGSPGNDVLSGGVGDDRYIVANAGDAVIELDGEGFDSVQTSVDYALQAGQSIEFLATFGVATTTNLRLTGNEIANRLVGNNGNNYLDGGGGADRMAGFLGDDRYIVDNAGDSVTEVAGQGFDSIQTSVDYTLGAGQSIEFLGTLGVATTTNLRLTGNEIANRLVGNNGDNYLDGGAGVDRLIGFLGDDVFVVDNAGDAVTELDGEGFDGVQTSVDYRLQAGQSVEWLGTWGVATSTNLRLFGNEIANRLVGNNGNNYLDGGAGADQMTGYLGDDVFVVDNGGDAVIELTGEGFDGMQTSVDYALQAGASVEWLGTLGVATTTDLRLFGNEIDNRLLGNAGNNYLDGGAGVDRMIGFLGDDLFIVDNTGDAVVELDGEGFDSVQTTVDYALQAGASVEFLGTWGVATNTNLRLFGNEIANRLVGNAGNNHLDGGAGADWLIGYLGDDLYVVDNAADVVSEVDGEGIDGAQTSVDYVLQAGVSVEWLGTLGVATTTDLSLTGNELSNQLFGNNGENFLDGKAGGDVLQGFGGADTFAFTTSGWLNAGNPNLDSIVDFQAGLDKIALDDAVFAGVTSGNLASVFVAGTQAQDADDRIIYDQATGALYFDADGSGSGAAVQFASLVAGTVLAASDFTVI